MLYYWNGRHVKVVEADLKMEDFKKAVLVKEVETFGASQTTYEYAVEEADLKPIATDAFSLGDTVKHGDYIGIVTAFEIKDNVVVTKPKKFQTTFNEHIRYGHKAHLIERHSESTIFFKSGAFYNVDGHVLMCVDTPFNDSHVSLVNARGKLIHKAIPYECEQASLLLQFGINSVTLTNQGEWTI